MYDRLTESEIFFMNHSPAASTKTEKSVDTKNHSKGNIQVVVFFVVRQCQTQVVQSIHQGHFVVVVVVAVQCHGRFHKVSCVFMQHKIQKLSSATLVLLAIPSQSTKPSHTTHHLDATTPHCLHPFVSKWIPGTFVLLHDVCSWLHEPKQSHLVE